MKEKTITEEQFLSFSKSMMEQISKLQEQILEVERTSKSILGELTKLQSTSQTSPQGHTATNYVGYSNYPQTGYQQQYAGQPYGQGQQGYTATNAGSAQQGQYQYPPAYQGQYPAYPPPKQ
eukprot:TRINITY_DN280_c0_g1_i9.p2 TRINITY_DN280_c0_g1~~TRINITY_DN280_c0_g1_i9.p2  ORF type:complete len:121 (-),score=19.09 TRINITY_DN280_c0_g1_i9:300-662(-)